MFNQKIILLICMTHKITTWRMHWTSIVRFEAWCYCKPCPVCSYWWPWQSYLRYYWQCFCCSQSQDWKLMGLFWTFGTCESHVSRQTKIQAKPDNAAVHVQLRLYFLLPIWACNSMMISHKLSSILRDCDVQWCSHSASDENCFVIAHKESNPFQVNSDTFFLWAALWVMQMIK